MIGQAVVIGVVAVFACIGLAVVLFWVGQFLYRAWSVLKGLDASLREGVALLREHRTDISLIRQIQQGDANSGVEEAFHSLVPQATTGPSAPLPPFPEPFLGRFTAKPLEPDAPAEDVDVTPTEAEVIDRNRIDNLKDMGLDAEPEVEKPAGRTVESF